MSRIYIWLLPRYVSPLGTFALKRQYRQRRIENRRGSHQEEKKDPKKTIWPTEKHWATHGRPKGGAQEGQNQQNERNNEENRLFDPGQAPWKGQAQWNSQPPPWPPPWQLPCPENDKDSTG